MIVRREEQQRDQWGSFVRVRMRSGARSLPSQSPAAGGASADGAFVPPVCRWHGLGRVLVGLPCGTTYRHHHLSRSTLPVQAGQSQPRSGSLCPPRLLSSLLNLGMCAAVHLAESILRREKPTHARSGSAPPRRLEWLAVVSWTLTLVTRTGWHATT